MNEKNDKNLPVKVGAKSKTIHVDYLARVEGEGSLNIKIDNHQVKEVQLKIFEPPRFFEAMLRGRQLFEAPDITARICGICPVAYQLSAVYAMEVGLGIDLPEYLHQLRRLMYCGEWIESHSLHIFMLHAPDFLGFPDFVEMAKKFPEKVKSGLKIKKAGNQIVKILGGREVHPINIKVGGFYKLPSKNELLELRSLLESTIEDVRQTILWVNQFEFPFLERNYEHVSLYHDKEYPMARGKICSNLGLSIPANDFLQNFEEQMVPYSTALHAIIKNKGAYFVGPMSRYNLCNDKLCEPVKSIIKEINFEKVCKNPFRSIIVRALEVYYAFHEAIRIIDLYDDRKPSEVDVIFKNAVCQAATEAPRGILFHRYEVDNKGMIKDAKIVPPTSQNQKTIEEDLYSFVKDNLHLPDDKLQHQCEQSIRNYDPCISCSTHFLNITKTKCSVDKEVL